MIKDKASAQGPAIAQGPKAAPLRKYPPVSATVTDYDMAHHATYLRLLDAESDGADWREVARVVLALDPIGAPDTAKLIWERHLARARWMKEQGYRQLLDK
jgi:hypothetical protein